MCWFREPIAPQINIQVVSSNRNIDEIARNALGCLSEICKHDSWLCIHQLEKNG